MNRIKSALQKVSRRDWLIALAIISFACVLQPQILTSILAVIIMIVGIAIAIAGIALILAIFPGMLILPFIPMWLKGRERDRELKELKQRVKDLEK